MTFAVLCLGDDLSTQIALRQTQGKGEMNPVMNAIFKLRHGTLWGTAIKWTVLILFVLALAPGQDASALLFLTVALGLVVLNNIRSILTYWVNPAYSTSVRSIPVNTKVYLVRVAELLMIAAFITYGANRIMY